MPEAIMRISYTEDPEMALSEPLTPDSSEPSSESLDVDDNGTIAHRERGMLWCPDLSVKATLDR